MEGKQTAVQQTDLKQVLDEAQLVGGHNHAAAVAHGRHWKLPLSLCIALHTPAPLQPAIHRGCVTFTIISILWVALL